MTVGQGDDERPLFTADKLPEIWTLYFMFRDYGTRAVLNYLENMVKPKLEEYILLQENEPYSTLIFESPLLDEARRREEITLALNDDTGPLSDMYSCGRCGAERTHVNSKQTRSVDEGPTLLIKCPVCKWSSKNTGQ
jgi:DNA-directed RNA polymerase subunit M/transcription elongation factor TFIIS